MYAEEFSTALKAAHLAIPPPDRPSGAAAVQWDERTLPFAGAVYAPETASEVHGRGVQTGMSWMTQSGPAPEGAWNAVWDSFCGATQGSGGTNAKQPTKDDGGDGYLWQDLVRWHTEVRKRDRVRLTERYALNLEAASLPPLKSLQPLEATLKMTAPAVATSLKDCRQVVAGGRAQTPTLSTFLTKQSPEREPAARSRRRLTGS